MSEAKKRAFDDKSGGSDGKKVKSKSDKEIPHPEWFNIGRLRTLTSFTEMRKGKCVLYWMARDQRARDNWALLLARHLAKHQDVPLAVCFNLTPPEPDDPLATLRQYGWMIKGLKEVEGDLKAKGIPMYLLHGRADSTVSQLAQELDTCAVVTDFSPLREPLKNAKDVANALESLNTPTYQVDAHNVVPVWEASPKLEIGARTIRKKIHDLFPEYFVPFPEQPLQANPSAVSLPARKNDWDGVLEKLQIDRSVKEIDWLEPGTKAGLAAVEDFIETRLKIYNEKRNDPTIQAISHLSPYFNFGHISVQSTMIRVKQVKRYHDSIAAFIEEGVVRRELSDNFCFYQPNYDSLEAAAGWALESLRVHESDPRQFLYTRQQLEEGKTHDKLWNAAQLQLVKEGKLHGFLRMYWAKKILEWTDSPDNALAYGLYFNDRFAIDGRDPNGFVGVGWSIMGVHDMGWTERTIFGKIRYMNYDGCCRKFDVDSFCRRYPEAIAAAAAAAPARPTTQGPSIVPKNSAAADGGSQSKSKSKSKSKK